MTEDLVTNEALASRLSWILIWSRHCWNVNFAVHNFRFSNPATRKAQNCTVPVQLFSRFATTTTSWHKAESVLNIAPMVSMKLELKNWAASAWDDMRCPSGFNRCISASYASECNNHLQLNFGEQHSVRFGLVNLSGLMMPRANSCLKERIAEVSHCCSKMRKHIPGWLPT